MSQLNDAILAVVGPQLNDGLVTHYQANGASANDLQGAEYEFLIAGGASPATLPDMWSELLGPGQLNDLLLPFWEAGGTFGPPLFSPEVQAVLNRMTNLTPTEISSIETYVDGLVADGIYTLIREIYAPCIIDSLDHLTGFKFMKLGPSAIPPTHVPGEGVDYLGGAEHHLDSLPFASFATVEGFIGVYNVFLAADVAQNSDLYGVATAGDECYFRWRGNDTFDFNAIYNTTGATPRTAANQRPTGDIVGMGLEGTTLMNLQPGGVIQTATRTQNVVPATSPMQWHGQIIDGIPTSGNVKDSRYSLMFHSNGISQAQVLTMRSRSLQFLRDIGVTGIPAT